MKRFVQPLLFYILLVPFYHSCNEPSKPGDAVTFSELDKQKSFFEESLVADNATQDTLLYYRFYLDSSKPLYKASTKLSIGVVFTLGELQNHSFPCAISYFGLNGLNMLNKLENISSGTNISYANCRRRPVAAASSSATFDIFSEWQGINPNSISQVFSKDRADGIFYFFSAQIKNCLTGTNCVRLKTVISDNEEICSREVYHCY